jgi:type I restriction enzyme S subunit
MKISFKDTEFEWLAPVPSNWSLLRVKEIFKSYDFRRVPISGQERERMTSPTYDYYGASGVIDKVEDYLFDGAFILIGEDGANLLTRSKPLAFIASGQFWVNNHAHILKPKKGFNLYYYTYLLESLDYAIWVSGSAQPKLTQENLNNVWLYVPSLVEQTAIAQYLNVKTQAIDKKVSLLEKKIGYYQELRKSLINDTVTQGFNKSTKLEQNELGFKTPSSWLKYRLKDLGKLFSGLSGKSGDDFNQDDNPNNKGFIPFTNIANNTYLKRDHLGTVVVSEGERQNQVRKGDIFFLMSSEGYEDIGKTAALAEDIEETYLNSFCKGYRVNARKCNPFFLNYLMLSDYYRQLLIIEGKGFTRINLKMEKVHDFLVFIPDALTVQNSPVP